MKKITLMNDDINMQVNVGDVGTYTRGGQYGRKYWDGFVVTKIISPRSVEVEFDKPILLADEEPISIAGEVGVIYQIPEERKIRILEYRRPGRWMFKGIPANKMSGHIYMGEKKTGAEEGIF